jgi:hypothetical protein
MEAMATGCAVVLCDRTGAGPLVTSGEFEPLRELNFGIRTLQQPLTAAWIGSQIDRFDAADALRVHELMRERGDLEQRLDELLELYTAALAAPRPAPDPGALAAAAANYLQRLAPRVKGTAFVEELQQRQQELARIHREPGLRLQAALSNLPLAGRAIRALGRRMLQSRPPRS